MLTVRQETPKTQKPNENSNWEHAGALMRADSINSLNSASSNTKNDDKATDKDDTSDNNCCKTDEDDEWKLSSTTGDQLQLLMGKLPAKLAETFSEFLEKLEMPEKKYLFLASAWQYPSGKVLKKQTIISQSTKKYEKITLHGTCGGSLNVPKYVFQNSEILAEMYLSGEKTYEIPCSIVDVKAVLPFLKINDDRKTWFFNLREWKSNISWENLDFVNCMDMCELAHVLGMSLKLRIRGLLLICCCELAERLRVCGFRKVFDQMPVLRYSKYCTY